MSTQLPIAPVKKKLLWFSPLIIILLLIPVVLKSGIQLKPANMLSSFSSLPNLNKTKPVLETATVEKGNLEKVFILDGELRAVRARSVFASGDNESKITYMPPEGTNVKAGERLVEFDNSPVSNKIREVQEKIISAENELVEIKSKHEAELRDLEVDLSRYWLAYEQAKLEANVPVNLVARRDYQERQLNLEKAKTEHISHLAKIEKKKLEQQAESQAKSLEKNQLEVDLQKLESQLESLNIKAPTDGIVIYADHIFEPRKVQIGDVVWSGFPVINLPDLTELEVLSQVNEVDGPRLSVGQTAQVSLDSYPSDKINAKIKEISQTAAKSRTTRSDTTKIFKVVFSLEKTLTDIMKPGMSAQIVITPTNNQEQLLIPRAAVKFNNNQAQVTKQLGEQLQTLTVNILESDVRFYAIAEDSKLQKGDKLVISQN